MTIREVLDSLEPPKRAQLMYAFEHDLTQFIEFESGKFIGVNTDYVKHLKSTTAAGKWRLGEIKR